MHTSTKEKTMIVRLMSVLLVFVLVAVIAFVVATQPPKAKAQGGLPFGGMISQVIYCTCSFNFAVYFMDLTVGSSAMPGLIYQPGGTMVYPNGPPLSSGMWMLGLWSPGAQCLTYVGKGCASIYPVSGYMTMVGTSG